jgi:hypothetical protein
MGGQWRTYLQPARGARGQRGWLEPTHGPGRTGSRRRHARIVVRRTTFARLAACVGPGICCHVRRYLRCAVGRLVIVPLLVAHDMVTRAAARPMVMHPSPAPLMVLPADVVGLKQKGSPWRWWLTWGAAWPQIKYNVDEGRIGASRQRHWATRPWWATIRGLAGRRTRSTSRLNTLNPYNHLWLPMGTYGYLWVPVGRVVKIFT